MATPKLTEAEMIAKIAALEVEVNAAKASTTSDHLSLRVSVKGAVSVYGLGRFPVTLYQPQMLRFLGASEEIKAFMTANDDKLSKSKPKAETAPVKS
jgi:hypothetical protein